MKNIMIDEARPFAGLRRGSQPRFWHFDRWIGDSRSVDLMLFLTLVALLTLLYSPVALEAPDIPGIGAIATHDIKAHSDILIEDKENTRRRQEDVAKGVPPAYDWDPSMMADIHQQLLLVLDWLGENLLKREQENTRKLREELLQELETDIPPRAFQALLSLEPNLRNAETKPVAEAKPVVENKPGKEKGLSPEEVKGKGEIALRESGEEPEASGVAVTRNRTFAPLRQALRQWLAPYARKRVVNGPEVIKDLTGIPFTVLPLGGEEEVLDRGVRELINLDDIRNQLEVDGDKYLRAFPEVLREWLIAEVKAQVRPNLVLNLAKTRERRQLAMENVDKVYFRARKGEMLVREGEIVTEGVHVKIRALQQERRSGSKFVPLTGLAVAVGLLLVLGRLFLLKTSPTFPREKKTFYILGAILLMVALVCTVVSAMGMGMARLFHWPAGMVPYLLPVAMASALSSLIVGARHGLPGGAVVIGTILAMLSSLGREGGVALFAYFMVGTLVGGLTLRACRHRFDVLKSGLWIGLAQMVAQPAMETLSGGELLAFDLLVGMLMALTSGLLTGLLSLALIPVFEWVFNITTDSRLMELASGDHPLIKQLSLRAPGTYHHSVMMGNLAEAAAESIGANPLMARVMALYHDIGKMTKPHYFVENQSGENRHDHLVPSMSVKIIIGHIKDGVELARQYKLGGPVLEAITEHQGTTLLQFFYNKATQEAAKRGDAVSEEEFRYPGPKPRSREAGILMIADAVEAAVRSQKNPTPAKIQAVVHRIVNSKIADGQLDDCHLTMRELARIEETFCRVLILGFYHHRIEYPDQIRKRREGFHGGPESMGQPGPSPMAPS
ncbi:MAG: HDIG domain-containing protein [Magnetococcales bacterium]|nr:HDIG domain-containing protein [Magnetococcales bacterium]